MKFLDVKTDFAFKKVFGSEGSKDILMSFLNSVIEFKGNRKITDLTIVDPYSIPLLKGMKDSYVDVKARLDDDSLVIIEMQVLPHAGFEKRVLYNAAKNYSVQIVKGQDYHSLNPVIALTITDFVMFKNSDKLINHFKLIEKEKFIEYTGDIELIFVELPKFKKTENQLETLQDKWIFFIQNAGSLEFIPDNLDVELKKAFEIANEAGLSKEELEIQHRKMDFIYIQKASIAYAEKRGLEQGFEKGIQKGIEKGIEQGIEKGIQKGIEKGIEQGIEQGIEKGIQKGIEQGVQQTKREIVLLAHQQGMTIEVIAGITGLTEDAVRGILKEKE